MSDVGNDPVIGVRTSDYVRQQLLLQQAGLLGSNPGTSIPTPPPTVPPTPDETKPSLGEKQDATERTVSVQSPTLGSINVRMTEPDAGRVPPPAPAKQAGLEVPPKTVPARGKPITLKATIKGTKEMGQITFPQAPPANGGRGSQVRQLFDCDDRGEDCTPVTDDEVIQRSKRRSRGKK